MQSVIVTLASKAKAELFFHNLPCRRTITNVG